MTAVAPGGDPGGDAAVPADDTEPRSLGWLTAVAAPTAAFAMLALAAGGGGFAWDASVLDALEALIPVSSSDVHVDPILDAVFALLAALIATVALLLCVRRRLRAAAFLLGAALGTVALTSLAKLAVQRPPIEGDPGEHSFPSGSAAWSVGTTLAFCLLASGRLRRAIAPVSVLLVAGIGAVIVWEEWHYPSDVAGGWLLALAWVSALCLVLRPRRTRLALEGSGVPRAGRARPSHRSPE